MSLTADFHEKYKKYVETYPFADKVSQETWFHDMLYGIGISIDKAYEFSDGFTKFMEDLKSGKVWSKQEANKRLEGESKMKKFKVGDKVKVVSQGEGIDEYTIGYIGIINVVEEDLEDYYELDNGWCYGPEELVCVSNEEIAKLRDRIKEEFESVSILGGRADIESSMMNVDNLIKYFTGESK
jgi:hypothetical protein